MCQLNHHVLTDTITIIMRHENITVYRMKDDLARIRDKQAYFHPSAILPAVMASRACNTQ